MATNKELGNYEEAYQRYEFAPLVTIALVITVRIKRFLDPKIRSAALWRYRRNAQHRNSVTN